jgi:hypothetical protein
LVLFVHTVTTKSWNEHVLVATALSYTAKLGGMCSDLSSETSHGPILAKVDVKNFCGRVLEGLFKILAGNAVPAKVL